MSLDPLLVLVCAEIETRWHDAVLDAGVFGVSVLAADQRPLVAVVRHPRPPAARPARPRPAPPRAGHRRRAARRRADAPRVPHHRHPPGRRPRIVVGRGACRSRCPTPWAPPWSTSADSYGSIALSLDTLRPTRSTGRSSRQPAALAGRRRVPLRPPGCPRRARGRSTSLPRPGSVTACRAAPPSPAWRSAAGGRRRHAATLAAALGAKAAQPIGADLHRRQGRRRPPEGARPEVDVAATVDGLIGFSLSPGHDVGAPRRWLGAARGRDHRRRAPCSPPPSTRPAAARRQAGRGRDLGQGRQGHASTQPVTGTTDRRRRHRRAVRRWLARRPHRRGRGRHRLAPKVAGEELERVRERVRRHRRLRPGHRHGEREVVQISARSTRPRGRSPPTAPRHHHPARRRQAARRGHAGGRRRPTPRSRPRTPSSPSPGARPTVIPHVAGVALDDDLARAPITAKAISRRRARPRSPRRPPSRSSPPPWPRRPCPRRRSPPSPPTSPSASRGCTTSSWPRASSTAPTSPPGEQFSMNGILGERTAAKGYIEAGIIRGGPRGDIVRRRHLAGVDDDLQRRLLLGHAARRVDAALLLHLPLPRGPRGDDLLGPTCTTSSPTPPTAVC